MKFEIEINEKAEVFELPGLRYVGRIDSDGDWRPSPPYSSDYEELVRESLKEQFSDRLLSSWPLRTDWPEEVLRFIGEAEKR